MDPVRRRTLQSLGSLVHLQRPIFGGAHYQRRGVHRSNGSRSITLGEFPPVKSIPLENKEVTRDNARESRGEDTERGLADFLKKALQEYEKQQTSKLSERREEKHFPPFKRVKNKPTNKITEPTEIKLKAPNKRGAEVEYVTIGDFPPFHPAFLRDACECEKCVDPSSRQKNFQTTDIPKDIKARFVDISPEGIVRVVWENDILGFEPGHKSVFLKEFFETHSHPTNQTKARFQLNDRTLWSKEKITRALEYVNYEEYMTTDEALFRAVRNLHSHGLLLVRGVPEFEKSVEKIANRIGNLRDTFYGRTWDVRCSDSFKQNERLLTSFTGQVRSSSQKRCIYSPVSRPAYGPTVHVRPSRLPIPTLPAKYL
jgi:hypothetical protein